MLSCISCIFCIVACSTAVFGSNGSTELVCGGGGGGGGSTGACAGGAYIGGPLYPGDGGGIGY